MVNNFCARPWHELHIEEDGNITPCCVMPSNRFPMGNGLQAYMKGDELRKIKEQFLRNERPEACEFCWKAEAAGMLTHRQIASPFTSKTISHIHLRLNNVCNYKCRMCNPKFSSTWEIENRKHNYFVHDYSTTKDMFEADPDLLPFLARLIRMNQLKQINISGGEPLLTDANFKLLSFLIDNKLTDVTLVYSTNLSNLDYKKHDLLALWKHFRRVNLHVSCDGWGEQNEYGRTGFVRKDFIKNFHRSWHHIIGVNAVVNMYSVWTLPELYKICKHFNTKMYFSPCFLPDFLNPQRLPVVEKEELRKLYEGIPELEHMYNTYISKDLPPKMKEFIEYNLMLDKYRKTDLFKTFPMYKKYWTTTK